MMAGGAIATAKGSSERMRRVRSNGSSATMHKASANAARLHRKSPKPGQRRPDPEAGNGKKVWRRLHRNAP